MIHLKYLAIAGVVLATASPSLAQNANTPGVSGALEGPLPVATASPQPFTPAASQPTAGQPSRATLDQPISLNVLQTSIQQVARQLSQETGVSVLVAPGAVASIDAVFTNTPVRSVLNSITRLHGLSWTRLQVPRGQLNEQTIASSLAKTLQPAATTVIVAGQEGDSPVGVLAGQTAQQASQMGAQLGLQEVIWIFQHGRMAGTLTPTTSEAVVSETQVTGAGPSEEPAEIYNRVAQDLSQMDPFMALDMLEQFRYELLSSLPSEQMMYYPQQYLAPATISTAPRFTRLNDVRVVPPRLAPVRIYTPGW